MVRETHLRRGLAGIQSQETDEREDYDGAEGANSTKLSLTALTFI